ncbi:hypothetical protein [Helicobacter sp. T3_23-1059]
MPKISLFVLFVADFKRGLQMVCQNLHKNIGQVGLIFAKLHNTNNASNIVVFGLDFGYDAQNSASIKTKTSKENL